MALDYNALAAWSALVASVTAVVALWAESRRSRFALGIDLLLKLDESFGADEMRTARRAAAQALRTEEKSDVEEVLDFFEMVGLLTRRGALDDTLVWHTFFYWIHRYCLVAGDYIATARAEDPTVWQDLVRLHARIVSIEKRERRCTDSEVRLSPDELRGFLDEEAQV